MKKLFSLLLIFLLSLCSAVEVSAITLKGRVTYQSKEVKDALANVDEVRKEAFANVQHSINISSHQKHFKDPYYRENKRFAKEKRNGARNRIITHFSDGCYGISYDDVYDITYYYNEKGKLESIEYDKNENASHRYNLEGQLHSVAITQKKIQYIFNANGDLITFWINSYGYNPDGQIILERW